MRIKEITYSVSGCVASTTKAFENLKPMFSLTIELGDQDNLESAKAFALMELKKSYVELENQCKAKLGR